jgi:hypothetical protein
MAQFNNGTEQPQRHRRSSLPSMDAPKMLRDILHRKSTSVSVVDYGEDKSAVGYCARCSFEVWMGSNRWEDFVEAYYAPRDHSSYRITGLKARGSEARTNATSGALAGRYVEQIFLGVAFYVLGIETVSIRPASIHPSEQKESTQRCAISSWLSAPLFPLPSLTAQ